MKKTSAFSLVELSIVILIIGVLVAAVGQGIDLYNDSKLSAARIITQGSSVNKTRDLSLWIEPTSEKSFIESQRSDQAPITNWHDINPQAQSPGFTASGTSSPLFVESAVNSLPCVRFDGVNDFMTMSPVLDPGLRNLTIFIVGTIRNVSPTFYHPLFGQYNSNNSDTNHFFSVGYNGNVGFDEYPPLNGETTSSIGRIRNDIPFILDIVRSNGSPSIYQQGVGIINNGVAEDYSGSTPLSTEIGRRGGTSSQFYQGSLCELIVFSRALNNRERISIENYLSKKWAIKLN